MLCKNTSDYSNSARSFWCLNIFCVCLSIVLLNISSHVIVSFTSRISFSVYQYIFKTSPVGLQYRKHLADIGHREDYVRCLRYQCCLQSIVKLKEKL